eukprot:313619-Amphidinium_carterae.2
MKVIVASSTLWPLDATVSTMLSECGMKIQKHGQEKLSSDVLLACDGALTDMALDPMDWTKVTKALNTCSKQLQGVQIVSDLLAVGSPLDAKLRLCSEKLWQFLVKVMDNMPEQTEAMEACVQLSKALGAKVSQGELEKDALLIAKALDGAKCVVTLRALQQLGPDNSESFNARMEDLVVSQRTWQHLQAAIAKGSPHGHEEAKGKIQAVAMT